MKDLVLFPIGSYEYHGEILPHNTDSVIASEIAKSISQNLGNSTLLPTLNYGISYEHSDFSLTATISTVNYYNTLMDILNSLYEPQRIIVLINAHGGNSHLLSVIESDYNYHHNDSKLYHKPLFSDNIRNFCNEELVEFDSHAGSVEMSLMAFYNNETKTYSIKDSRFIKPMPGALRFFRNAHLGNTGVVKSTDTIIVNPKIGAKIHTLIVKELVEDIKKTSADIFKHLRTLGDYDEKL